ncbi:DoxX family protein [Shinella sp.]|uniref:DoxX family protein n=1 Tax=Shinella sp. TaxID=1870904 RepID=UPI00258F9DD4|nr:DoxX family protein [Shinella sp.]MCW5712687.1 DoxX family protein [Shinella sp.]
MKTATAPDLATPLPQRLLEQAIQALDRIPNDLIALVARLSIAAVFWRSGQTKLDGWSVSDSAVYLFENEYKLPFVDPWLAAHLAAFAEHLFPLLLVIGLASRFSALALLAMTLVIEIFVYPDAWPTHGTWAVSLLFIAARGPGLFSIDAIIARQARSRRRSG